MYRWLLVSALTFAVYGFVDFFVYLMDIPSMMGFTWIIGIASSVPLLWFEWYQVLDLKLCFPLCICGDVIKRGEESC